MSRLDKARVIQLPKICDPRGNLSFAEGARHIPFSIKRVFFVYDVPGGETRGGHAHRRSTQVLLAPCGSFVLRLSDGINEKSITLNRSNMGVLIPPGIWATMTDFTSGTVMLALASDLYEEEDYIRDFDEYCQYVALITDQEQ